MTHKFVLFPSVTLNCLKLQSGESKMIPMIPFDIVAYAFVGQPFSKRLYNECDNVWTVIPDTFESDDVAKSCPVSYRTINQYGGTTCRPTFSRVNPDTIGCVCGQAYPI